MRNGELAMQAWIDSNLGVTTATLPNSVARRFVHLQMRDYQSFYSLAIYGFVMNRRLSGEEGCFPEAEFMDFCGEFIHKLEMVLKGKGRDKSLPMFQRVGKK